MKEVFASWYRAFPLGFFALNLFWGIPNIWSIVLGSIPVIAGVMIIKNSGLEQNAAFAPYGMYTKSRGAGYFANTLLYIGYSVMTFALFPYMQLAGGVALWLYYSRRLRNDEVLLAKKYGAEYTEYAAKTSSFFPSGISLKGNKASDKSIVAVNVFFTVTIVLLWFFRRLS